MDNLFRDLDRAEREDNLAHHAHIRAFSAFAAERTEANRAALSRADAEQKRTRDEVRRLRRIIWR